MNKLIQFFIKAGKLKDIPRRGWVLIGAKKPASISDHLYRLAMMAWVLGKEKEDGNLDVGKAIKMALVHDFCELYAGDATPYDKNSILPKDEKKWPALFDKWPRFSRKEKEKLATEKHCQEEKGLDLALEDLSPVLRQEIKNIWLEYEKGLSVEARFVKQLNRLETLLQALEYGKEENKRPYKSWWIGTKEIIDDPFLLEFMEALDKSFHFFEEDGVPRPAAVN